MNLNADTDSIQLSKNKKFYRISNSEYELIEKILGRAPKGVEWALFSALWSEHCSYKSSKIHLKKFARTMNQKVVSSHGENAGIVDLGFGERIAFKMESHNHPSFIEPFQGAATGVGGILRDIFTMGARPIALADFLCFGPTDSKRMPFLMDGVVRGISSYGNCVGVPTVTGKTHFHPSYQNNILVNAMAVGLFESKDRVALSAAKGIGNWVVYVGAKTGKDGVHGAAMASESFDENSEAKKPNVQIGDPYFEKLLIESCLKVIQEDLVVSIQDMGAAGLTSSSFEMASKGQVGMKIDLARVPLRDSTMTPEEILLSESQERMLLICQPQQFEKIKKHFMQWGLDVSVIGEVVQDRKVSLYWNEELLTSLDPDLLVENAPVYQREFDDWTKLSQDLDRNMKSEIESVSEKTDWSEVKKRFKIQQEQVEFASRWPIYQQYDQRVGAKTAKGADSDVALLRLPESGRGLAVSLGCRPHLMSLNARLGALDAIVYPVLQMASKGARAVAITDCLNFGNPEKKQIMSEFVASVDAIVEASLAFDSPVISGNVSFYNETQGQNIASTPAVGIIGVREKGVEEIALDFFSQPNESIFLLKTNSVLLENGKVFGKIDLDILKELQEFLIQAESSQIFNSSQLVGLQGILWELAKMCLKSELGVQLLDEVRPGLIQQNNLYQLILSTGNPEVLSRFFDDSSLKGLGCELVEIGITQFTREIRHQDKSLVDLKEWSLSFEKGLVPYFAGL